jgi:hypothetical protein
MDVSLPGTGKMVRVLKAVTNPRNMSDLSVVITKSGVSANQCEDTETRIAELAAGRRQQAEKKN